MNNANKAVTESDREELFNDALSEAADAAKISRDVASDLSSAECAEMPADLVARSNANDGVTIYVVMREGGGSAYPVVAFETSEAAEADVLSRGDIQAFWIEAARLRRDAS